MTAQDQPTSANVTPLQISTTEHMDEHIKAMVELLRRNNAILGWQFMDDFTIND